MSETMSVQWFPGHMAKTRRIMASNLKLVDIVVELCDARIPQSSRNPEIDKIVGKKPRLMLLNKADCADAAATEQWLTYYRKKGDVIDIVLSLYLLVKRKQNGKHCDDGNVKQRLQRGPFRVYFQFSVPKLCHICPR